MVGESISKLPVEKEFNNLTLNACKENCCGAMNGMFISWRDHVPTRLKNIYWHWRNGCHFCLPFSLWSVTIFVGHPVLTTTRISLRVNARWFDKQIEMRKTDSAQKDLWAELIFYVCVLFLISSLFSFSSQANKIGIPPFFCYSTNSSEPNHSLSAAVATHHLTTPPPAHCGIPPYQLDAKGIGKLINVPFVLLLPLYQFDCYNCRERVAAVAAKVYYN